MVGVWIGGFWVLVGGWGWLLWVDKEGYLGGFLCGCVWQSGGK